MVCYDNKIFIGKRDQWPQRDYWYGCGGRMKPGETLVDSVHRLLLREVKLNIEKKSLERRVSTIGYYSFVWGKREQQPQSNGTADISIVVHLTLTKEEFQSMKTDYKYSKWKTAEDILKGDDYDYHPALRRGCADLIRLQKFQQLNDLLLNENSIEMNDKEKLQKVKEYLLFHSELTSKDNQIIYAEERQ